MTAPARTPAPAKTTVSVSRPESSSSGGFGTPTPPDHRTTALQSAVAVLRGNQPVAKTEDVLAMAEAFFQFLKKGNIDRPSY